MTSPPRTQPQSPDGRSAAHPLPELPFPGPPPFDPPYGSGPRQPGPVPAGNPYSTPAGAPEPARTAVIETGGRPGNLRRLLAWAVDFALVLLLAWALGHLAAARITEMVSQTTDLTSFSTWELLTGNGDTRDRVEELARTLWDRAATVVIQAFAVLAAATFLYHWAALALTGRTLGKALFGLRVTPRSPGRTAARAALTTVSDVAVFSLACCLLLLGEYGAALFAWAAAVAVFWLNALPGLSSSGRTLSDRIAGTQVIRPLR
ncbi:RDD family protein [Streptomyces sp. NPDC000594]|uniref:RDD family protein n=1 Tax=Streptomyces sp. NPDC000594 TaxID=3154261 RepID=UPI0033212064